MKKIIIILTGLVVTLYYYLYKNPQNNCVVCLDGNSNLMFNINYINLLFIIVRMSLLITIGYSLKKEKYIKNDLLYPTC